MEISEPQTSNASQISAPAGSPPKPQVKPKDKARINKMWAEIENLPNFKEAAHAFRECRKALNPKRYNIHDPFRGKKRQELKTGEDKRRVQIPIIYRNAMQTVAMTVPDDHTFRWMPRQLVAAQPGPTPEAIMGVVPSVASMLTPMGPDPLLKRFAETIECVERELLNEISWQEIIEAWVQDATHFPMGVLKLTFVRDFTTDPIKDQDGSKDESENIARLRSLQEAFARGEFNENSREMSEMASIIEGLGGKSELKTWWGISAENLAMTQLRIAPNVRSIETVYSADWMSEDILMTRRELVSRFPYKILEQDADGNVTKWSGIHPDDAKSVASVDSSTYNLRSNAAPGNDRRLGGNPDRGGMGGISGADDDLWGDQILVREVWNKRDNCVEVLTPNVDYAISRWVPEKQSAQWFPFVVLVLNRAFGDVYGISDTELQEEVQTRINRKRSDEEKARWLSLPRGVYNTALSDGQEITKLEDIAPGKLRGVNFGNGAEPDKMISWMKYDYSPESFSTLKDEQDGRFLASLPEQALGVTGRAAFATEVSVAAQGAATSLNFRQNRVRRALERCLTVVAEILLQELTPEQARKVAGAGALWPTVYSEAEANKLEYDIRKRHAILALPQVLMEAQQLALTTGAQLSAQELRDKVESVSATTVQAEMQQRFGFTEPVSREALYRRLKCKVDIGMNGRLDLQQRATVVLQMMQGVAQTAQAMSAAGMPFNPRPLVKKVASLLTEDADLDEMFPPATMAPTMGMGPMGQAVAAQAQGVPSAPATGENGSVSTPRSTGPGSPSPAGGTQAGTPPSLQTEGAAVNKPGA